jgi:hypothetical protein
MACSLPAGLRTKSVACATLIGAALLASAPQHTQDPNRYILATRRSGAIEIIDPESLATLGRIHFDLPSKSVGLNGISAGADGTTLYVEGPIPNGPNRSVGAGGCCVLYSVDLATLQTKQVAGVGGSASRARFVTSDGITYAAAPRGSAPPFPQGAADLFDSAQARIVSGIWMNGRMFFYGTKEDGSDALLWSGSPDASELGHGVSVDPFAKVPGCSSNVPTVLAGAAENLFLYERFGWIDDRRTSCSRVPGGAWIIDPSTGKLLAHVAPDLYFSALVPDREKGELYGISVGDPDWRNGIELVRMDARDGSVLRSRILESDFWRIAFAPLRTFPAADVHALISAKK